MVRFKNRYLLFELVWKDGRLDDSISEPGGGQGAVLRACMRQCQPCGGCL